jgi:hypothetical protein
MNLRCPQVVWNSRSCLRGPNIIKSSLISLQPTNVLAYLPFLRRNAGLLDEQAVCVCLPQILNQFADFSEMWYERYAIESYPHLVIFNPM